ncbi:VPS37A isoform 10 [Pan troglodytes]|uniref:VPS37A subunit of ESCRT-I n=3 Tax=Hominidae TaxID=9604 RepID=E5RJ10_HUMAN|nr:VPS37A subunit of ESCRT-I [Homo sapiens]KAI4009639.1 VPS37A subunit of ESCRT-I [Homo sapiens]PNI34846.1 VPS37A isoform 10 [Pan troglodytes]PNJ76710.1 VPS37A isoform 2 [Pongo abelii]
MSWLFPLTKSASSSAAGSPGGLTSLQQQKQRLIESLRNSHSRYKLCWLSRFCD